MEKSPTYVLVVAAALIDGSGRLLLQQCHAHKRHAGKWELPGGKVKTGENPKVALCWELMEELGITVSPDSLEPAGFAEDPSVEDGPEHVMLLYTCAAWHGQPEGREGQRWGWFTPAEAGALDMPAMDRALLRPNAAGAIAKLGQPAYVAPSKRARSSAG